MSAFPLIETRIRALSPLRRVGRVCRCAHGTLCVEGLADVARLGDRVRIRRPDGRHGGGEVLSLDRDTTTILPDMALEGVAIDDMVDLHGPAGIAPDARWIGRIVDPFGQALDGRPLPQGGTERELRASPPPPAGRKGFGARLETGMATFNTLLPLVRGQRLGLFAGSGVGKSTLLGDFARNVSADIVVIALIGERGRELRDFVETVLGPQGMARSIVVAATSDQSPLVRRRAAWAAMAIAEHFRDAGQHVLLLADSITRFAEAHREVALASGEPASLRGFPPSTAHMIMALAERAGPGPAGGGDITAVFTVLVAASDMEEPIADILRGVLDGHVVLDRAIAERGRFPAVDLLRSVSRSLPDAATARQNALVAQTRRLLGAYERAEAMIQAGLYAHGSDPETDAAITVWPAIDAFLACPDTTGIEDSFAFLEDCLGDAAPQESPPPAGSGNPPTARRDMQDAMLDLPGTAASAEQAGNA